MSKASRARYAANRANARLSHGPTSPEGKHRSSQNALRHGLTGRVVVLPTEDMEAYKKFSKEIVDSLDAQTPLERQFAQTVADSQWRLNRARTFEDGMIAMGHFEAEGNFTAESPDIHSALTAAKVFRDRSKDFVNLSLYEQRIGRAQKDAYRQLRDLQAERKAAAPPPVPEEKPVTNPLTLAAKAAATTTPSATSEKIRFVCSTLELQPAVPAVSPLRTPERKAA